MHITKSKHERAVRIALSILAMLLCLTLLVSCDASEPSGDIGNDGFGTYPPSYNGNSVLADTASPGTPNPSPEDDVSENGFISSVESPVSTFSSDVDTASYAYFRKLVNSGYSFSEIRSNFGKDLRTEEMLNYFSYHYTAPNVGDIFGIHTEIAPCPWNENSALLMMNLTAESIRRNENGNNLVFLIDVSGSMRSQDKLPLLKTAFTYLTESLTERDTVSIVTYSGEEKVVLEGCRGDDRERILTAINALTAEGSTNGQAGIQKAYEIAESCMITGGNNRIIMASDGDLNVGISSADALKTFISEKRDAGIFLSVLGFGTGNYKDSNMEALADNGNGVYYYIDGEKEAERIFGEGLLGTLYTVAKDVKLQITFNPAYIRSYRLIGYENRLLSEEDFEDDTKDAGEVGSGHTLTVCYELILEEDLPAPDTEAETAWFTLAVRYKATEGTESVLREYSFGASSYTSEPSLEFRFATGVIETAMLLHKSQYIGDLTLSDVIARLETMSFTDADKSEFVALLKKAQQ